LDLAGIAITDAGLVHIGKLTKLEGLYMMSTRITDAGLADLKILTNLRVLAVSETQVTDEGFEKLRKTAPNCRIDWGLWLRRLPLSARPGQE